MLVALKVKIKTLAYEATVIHKEERKAINASRYCLGYRPVQTETSHGNVTKLKKDPSFTNGELVQYAEHHNLRYTQLRDHRVKLLRVESRLSNLAYAYLRGKTFQQVENAYKNKVFDFKQVAKMAERFSDVPLTVTEDNIKNWFNASRS